MASFNNLFGDDRDIIQKTGASAGQKLRVNSLGTDLEAFDLAAETIVGVTTVTGNLAVTGLSAGSVVSDASGNLSIGAAAASVNPGNNTIPVSNADATAFVDSAITTGGFTSLGDAPVTTINSIANVTFGYRSASHNGTMWIQLPLGSTTTGATDNYRVATIGGATINVGTTNIGVRLGGVDYLIPFNTSGSNRFATVGTDNQVGPFTTANGASSGAVILRLQQLQARAPGLYTTLEFLASAGTATGGAAGSNSINVYTGAVSVGTITADVQIDGNVDIIGSTVQQGTFVIDTGVVDLGIGSTSFDIEVNATSNGLSRINSLQINTFGATLSSTTGTLALVTGTDGFGTAQGMQFSSAGDIQLTTNNFAAGGSITAHGTIEGGLNGNESPLIYIEDTGSPSVAGGFKFRIADSGSSGTTGYITFVRE